MLRRYVELKDHEYVAVSLWIAHTYIYDRFAITPRLALTSPTSDCGKTTLLLMLEALCASPHKSDDITPAALFRLIERASPRCSSTRSTTPISPRIGRFAPSPMAATGAAADRQDDRWPAEELRHLCPDGARGD